MFSFLHLLRLLCQFPLSYQLECHCGGGGRRRHLFFPIDNIATTIISTSFQRTSPLLSSPLSKQQLHQHHQHLFFCCFPHQPSPYSSSKYILISIILSARLLELPLSSSIDYFLWTDCYEGLRTNMWHRYDKTHQFLKCKTRVQQ